MKRLFAVTGCLLLFTTLLLGAFLQNEEQVLNRVLDGTNSALRVNAVATGGGTPASVLYNTEQIFNLILDGSNDALQINCISGCGTSPRLDQITAPTGDTTIDQGVHTVSFPGTGATSFGGSLSAGGDIILGSNTLVGLGTPADGHISYCTNCDTPTSPGDACSTSGDTAGAEAHRIRNAWKCF